MYGFMESTRAVKVSVMVDELLWIVTSALMLRLVGCRGGMGEGNMPAGWEKKRKWECVN